MANPNFGALLDRAPTEIERPKPMPVGSYITIIQGTPRYDKSAKKQTEFVEFTHKFVSAGDDVDADELKEALTSPSGETKALNEVTMKNTFYLTENSLWRLKDFLEHCGFDVNNPEASLRKMIEETTNSEVGVVVRHEASQDGQSIFARIDKTFAV